MNTYTIKISSKHFGTVFEPLLIEAETVFDAYAEAMSKHGKECHVSFPEKEYLVIEPKQPAIAKMNYYDNYKLIAFIREHGINVISCTPYTIKVESQFCNGGIAYTEEETIGASMNAVKDYLGY
jgi:hypothetical protein